MKFKAQSPKLKRRSKVQGPNQGPDETWALEFKALALKFPLSFEFWILSLPA